MYQCPNCGNAIYEQTRFCPHCSFDFAQPVQPPPVNYQQAAAPAYSCPNCRAAVAPGARFCPNCATPFQSAPGYAQPGYPQPGPQYPQMNMGYGQGYQMAPVKKGSRKLVIVLVIVGIAVAALVGLYVLGSHLLSPANQTKEFLQALEKGDTSGVSKILAKDYKKQANLNAFVTDASKWFKDNGGIKEIVIDKEDVSDTVATINYTLKLGNGQAKTGSTRFIKEDLKWKLLEDQTPIASASANPGGTVVQFVKYVEAGNSDGAMGLFSSKMPKEAKDKMKYAIPLGSQGLKAKGGVKSVDILNEDVKGETAEVKYKIVYGNGTEDKNESFKLVKENGEWKIDADTKM